MSTALRRTLVRGGLAAAALWPFVLTAPQASRTATSALAAVLVAASLVVTVGWLRTITLFQPAALGIAAWITARTLGDGQALALSLALALAAGAAVALGCLALAGGRPRAGLPPASLAVAALVALVLLPRATVPPFPRPVLLGIDLAGDRPLYLAGLAFVVALLAALRRLGRSDVGRRLAALGGGEGLAVRCGIDVRGAWIEGVALAGVLAGGAGWLLAVQARGMPDPAGYSLTAAVTVLAYPLLGGASSLAGAAGVAVVLTVLPALGTGILLDHTVLAAAGLAVAALLRPDGLAGVVTEAGRGVDLRAGRWETPRWRVSR